MRIRKKCPLPSLTPFPGRSMFGKILAHVPLQQEKIEVSLSTTSMKEPQGLHYDRCFSVVEENRRIGWPCYKSNKSLHHLIGGDLTQQLMNPRGLNGSVCSKPDKEEEMYHMPYAPSQVEGFQGEVESKENEKSSSTITGSYPLMGSSSKVVEVIAALGLSSSSSHLVESVYEEEKLLPLKKRKMMYESIEMITEKKEAMVTKVEAKETEECSQEDYNEDIDCDLKKRREKGKMLMKVSRCSRSSGQGWRCPQMTLVGYTLCELHLGHSKIRSLSSIGNTNSSVDTGAKMDDESNKKSN